MSQVYINTINASQRYRYPHLIYFSESLVVKEGVLNQAPEFAKARKLANLNAASIFDLLSLAAGRWGQFYLLNDVSLDSTEDNTN